MSTQRPDDAAGAKLAAYNEADERQEADLKERLAPWIRGDTHGHQAGDPMTLTEFLLARIAEDEEAAAETFTMYIRKEREAVVGVEFSTSPRQPPGLRVIGNTDSGPFFRFGHTDPARLLAECEAKRRIVHAHEYLVADPELRMQAWTFALRALALPYADHPDYDEKWKL